MAKKLKTTRKERIRQVLQRFTYQSSRPGYGRRHLQPHHIDALAPYIERLVTREVRYARQGGRDV